MDLSLISLVLSVLALIIALLVLREHRKKTRIMNDQLRLQQEEDEIKREIRDAMRLLDGMLGRIAKLKTMYDFGEFGSIVPLRLIEKLRDCGEDILPLRINVYEVDGCPTSSFSSFESFQDFFENKAEKFRKYMRHNAFMRALLNVIGKISTRFKPCDQISARIRTMPEIEMNDIEIGKYMHEIYFIRWMHKELRRIEKSVNMFDRSVIPDILGIYHRMLRSIFDSVKNEHTLNISPNMESKQMLEELLKVVGLNSWRQCVSNMQNIIVPRLYDLKKQMLQSL